MSHEASEHPIERATSRASDRVEPHEDDPRIEDDPPRASMTAMAMYQMSPPDRFNFAHPEEWSKWIRRFERFRVASGLDAKDDEAQVNTLVYSMGDDADDILRSFQLSADDCKKYDIVKSKFDRYFVKDRNVIYERAKFNQRRQEEGEPVDTFVTALYGLSEHCGYGELHDEMIRDRIVVGIRDSALAMKLQLNSTLTLSKAVAAVRQAEAVKQQQPLLRGGSQSGKPETPVGMVQQKKGRPVKNKQATKTGSPANKQSTQTKCGRCGKFPFHDRQQCPAHDAVCHKCAKRGHFQSMCRSTAKVAEVHRESDTADNALLGHLSERPSKSPWSVTLSLNGKPTQFEIDTGAEVTVISPQTHKDIGSPKLHPPQRILRGPSNRKLQVKGQFTGKLCRGKKEVEQQLYVVKNLRRQLLGCPAIEQLDLIARIGTVQNATRETIMEEFPSLFRGLGKLQGDYTIQLREGATPFALGVPRRVAIPLMKQVGEELKRMEQLGVIAKVSQPTEWCAGMVVVPKNNGKVRICVDLTRLNESVCRERHPLPAVEQTLAQLAGATVFSKLDANSGFWQIPLSQESALLTTFITPFGRYCFHRLPFGITSAPEHFQRRMSSLLENVGVICMMDDILVHGRTTEEHDERLTKVLCRLEKAGLTLNRDKCQFSKTQVKFLGQVIDHNGIRPDPDKVAAIQNVPTPTNVGDVKRFLGMVNHLSKFSPNLSDKTKPLRDLLIKSNQWVWGEPQQKAFQEIKEGLVSSTVLALFDANRETVVSADASSYGLGAVLLQKQPDGELKPISYILRSLTPTEQRYAQIEKEALAFTWACERFCDYLVGIPFHINTDHKPLVPLFSSKKLDELPIRVQRFRLRMMRFSFTISHVPGQSLLVADTLSRAPLATSVSDDTSLQLQTAAYVKAVVQSLPASEKQLERIKQHQQEDEVCQQVVSHCQSGWPLRQELMGPVRCYYPVATELSIADGLLMRGNRIVIPAALRLEMLDRIHTGHQGISKCRERARQSIWWPGLSKQLEELVKCCAECCRVQNQRAEPLIPSKLPEYPWQKVGTDLFEWKKDNYLLIVDYYSRYIEVAKLKRTTAEEVILHTKSIFARHGIPEVIISDNGPQYVSAEYQNFAQKYEFEHITSSPYYPQSNGEAERAVQTVKSLLKKEGDPYLALLAYRTTPLQSGFSPSELLMSRKLRTNLPTTREQLKPKIPDPDTVRERDMRSKGRQQNNYDRHHRVRELPSLNLGDAVWIPDRQEEGIVTGESGTRSFEVQTSEGSYRRNRRALVQMPEDPIRNETDNSELSSTTKPVRPKSPVRRSSRQPRPPDRFDPSWSS